jgi:hypothetical protein
MKIITITLLCFCSLFSYSQLQIDIGVDKVFCEKDSGIFICTVISGTPATYTWISTIANFTAPNSPTTRASFSASGEVILKVTSGTMVAYDTALVFINPLPTIALGSDQDVCCDYGTINLNFSLISPTGTPATGGWSCTQYPTLVNGNLFYTDDACALISSPARSIPVYATYNYIHPSTLCPNQDSMLITVRSLPSTILIDKQYCQDMGSIRLDNDVVLSPANTALGVSSWKCLDSNSADNYFYSDMLENRGSGFAADWWLNVDESNYTIQNPDKDTIVLEFTYLNEFGCRGKDTVNIEIWRVPKIEFSTNRELCWDEGKISLNALTGVNFTDATWSVYDSSGFNSSLELGQINGDTINTMNALSTGGTYIIRCVSNTQISTGCPAYNDTTLTINPLPTINLIPLSLNRFCETVSNVKLTANPAGGVWSSNDPSALINNDTFSPESATRFFPDTIRFRYDYTSSITGCSSIDSIEAFVDLAPVIFTPDDTTFCRMNGVTTQVLNKVVTAQNTDQLNWINFSHPNKVSLKSIASGDIALSFDTTLRDTFRILVFAQGIGSCNDRSSYFDIIVHHESNCILGVNGFSTTNRLMYPNPTSGLIHLEEGFEIVSCINTIGQSVRIEKRATDSYYIEEKGLQTMLIGNVQTGAYQYKKVVVE